jgi:hypothetical protein
MYCRSSGSLGVVLQFPATGYPVLGYYSEHFAELPYPRKGTSSRKDPGSQFEVFLRGFRPG